MRMKNTPTISLTIIIFYVFLGWQPSMAKVQDSTFSFKPKSVALNFSSRGCGAEIGFLINKNPLLGLRINASYFSFGKSQNIQLDKGTSLDIFPNIQTLVIGSLVDYYPFKRKAFRLSGGISYDAVQQYQVAFSSASGLDLGGLQIAGDDFGNIDFGVKWNAIRPYFGVGFGKSVMKHQVGLGFDMGVAYMGSPKLSLLYEGFLETTTIDNEMKKIESNMRGYSYYPYLAFQLKYNLCKRKK